jgi:hypothetical protein
MSKITPADLIDASMTERAVEVLTSQGRTLLPEEQRSVQELCGQYRERILAHLDTEGFVIVPVTDPNQLRREALRSFVSLGYLVTFVSPVGIAFSAGSMMRRAGDTPWAYIGWPVLGAFAWMYVLGRLSWATRQIVDPSDRYRRKVAVRLAAEAADRRVADQQAEEADAQRRLIERAKLAAALTTLREQTALEEEPDDDDQGHRRDP